MHMRDVWLRVFLVVATVLGPPAVGYTAAQKAKSAYDELDPIELDRALEQLGMHELRHQLNKDVDLTGGKTVSSLVRAADIKASAADTIMDLAERSERLAKFEDAGKLMEKAVDLAETELNAAKKAADAARGADKSKKKREAAKAALAFYDAWYRLGDMAGRKATRPYAYMMRMLQDNSEDRRTVRELTAKAVRHLDDMQADLKDVMRDWKRTMAVWMIYGSKGEVLLRQARYWSCMTYIRRALAMGDDEAHKIERQELRSQWQQKINQLPKKDARGRKKLAGDMEEAVRKLSSTHNRQTAQRKKLLMQVLGILPEFQERRSGVHHDARRLMALAYRELGQYDKAINLLAPARYQGASAAMAVAVAMELPIVLTRQGKFDGAAKAIENFAGYAELKRKPRNSQQRAQIDLEVAMLKDYLYRRWAASSSNQADKNKYRTTGQKALIAFLDKYKDEGMIRRAFFDFFGNRHVHRSDFRSLSSVQLYIVTRGAAARNEPESRRAMMETLLARAEKNKPAAVQLRPQAHWQLGFAMNSLGRSVNAADNFMAALKLFGDKDPKAPLAAEYATKCMEKYVEWLGGQNRSLTREERLKCVAAMTRAVAFDKQYPAMKLSKWYYRLGAHCEKLSWGGPSDGVDWVGKAVSAFAKVPSDPPFERLKAEEVSLDLRYRKLTESKGPGVAAKAMKLRNEYPKFISNAEKFIKTADATTQKARIDDMKAGAASADFIRARLLAEQMGQETAGLAEVVQVLEKWTEVEKIVIAANQWKIQKLVDIGKIQDASKELQAFLAAHKDNPDAGAGLVKQVVDGIQDKLNTLRDDDPEKAAYASSYMQLARHQYARIEGKPLAEKDAKTGKPKVNQQRLTLTQLWIDALIHNKKGPEAMELALACDKIFGRQREAQADKIRAKYKPMIEGAPAAIDLPIPRKKVVDAYVAEIERLIAQDKKAGRAPEFKLKEDTRQVLRLLKLVDDTPANATLKERKRRQSELSLELIAGYKEIIRRLRNRIPKQLTVEWNLAKCYGSTGEYAKALDIYVFLIKGTDPRTDRASLKRYWRLQLEWCMLFEKAYEDMKKEMARLDIQIKRLLKNGGAMGGFKENFYAIQQRAAKRASK